MSIVYSQITLDVLKLGTQATVNAKTGDANSRGVEITLVKGGEPYEIPKYARAIIRAKINGSTVFNDATIEGNTIKYTFTTGDVAVAGAWAIECQIIEGSTADPLSSLYSPCFKLLVEDTLYSDREVRSQDQFDELTEAIAQVQDALEETDNLNISASKSGDTTTVTITHKDGTESSVAIRDGEQGEQGDPGEAATLSLGTVTTETLTPTSPATVEITEGGTAQDRTLSFAFGVPKGDKGEQGDKGDQGAAGSAAEITSVSADATTLDPDEAATASVATGGTAQARSFSFSFGIPKGDKGDTGAAGQNGQNGAAAGFGTISATATAGESASASVETSGPDTAKNLAFSFVIPSVADGSVTTAKLADEAVTDAKIASVSAGKILRQIPINGVTDGVPNRIIYDSLPADCIPLAYLESTGTQYIDTGIQPAFNRSSDNTAKTTGIVLVGGFDPDKQTSVATENYCFGAAAVAHNQSSSIPPTAGINLFRSPVDGSIRGIYSNQLAIFNGGTGKVQMRTAVLSGSSQRSLYLYRNNIYSTSLSSISDFTQNASIYLCGLNINGGSPLLAKGFRIMFCRLTEDTYADGAWVETPVRQFFPVLDPNGIPAMFDTISQTYFYNAGSGQFLWG